MRHYVILWARWRARITRWWCSLVVETRGLRALCSRVVQLLGHCSIARWRGACSRRGPRQSDGWYGGQHDKVRKGYSIVEGSQVVVLSAVRTRREESGGGEWEWSRGRLWWLL